jgi:hypothetical protein
MWRKSFLLGIIIFGCGATTYAQLPHTFTQTAQIADGGDEARGSGVAVAPDGTVFFANGGDGLRAYGYDGTSFTNTAYIHNIEVAGFFSFAGDLAVTADSTVFLRISHANPGSGYTSIQAYSYTGSSFVNTTYLDIDCDDLTVASDGTVFIAGNRGLWAYGYDGSSFTNVAHINDGGSARGVAVASDGTVFLANDSDGLRAYNYDGSSFTNIAHINDGGDARSVAVAPDGTVFLSSRDDGLRAYSFDGASFTNTAHINNGDRAGEVTVAPDGTVFLANHDDGLRAYHYDGTSFTVTAHINDGGDANGVAVGADGTVFLANGEEGLFAYTYSGVTTQVTDAFSQIPNEFELRQNYPNPFNPSTTIEFSLPQSSFVSLKIYNLLGAEVATLLEARKPAGQHNVSFDASTLASGLYYYTLTAGDPSTGSGQAFKQSRKMLLLR